MPTVRVKLIHDAEPYYGKRKIRCADDIYQFIKSECQDSDREMLLTIGLDGAHQVVSVETTSIGSINQAIVSPREIFKSLILGNCSSFVLVHNHPSGEPTPSAEDVAITKRVGDGAKLLGFNMLDHLIVGQGKFYSFQESGEL